MRLTRGRTRKEVSLPVAKITYRHDADLLPKTAASCAILSPSFPLARSRKLVHGKAAAQARRVPRKGDREQGAVKDQSVSLNVDAGSNSGGNYAYVARDSTLSR